MLAGCQCCLLAVFSLLRTAHRVRRQFGFDQEVSAVMGIAASEIPTINPFLKTRAFAYWSGVAPKVVISSGNRVVFIPLL